MSKQGTRYLTTRDVADILGVTAPTVIKWVEDGRISAHRTPGGHRRIAEGEVIRFAGLRGIDLAAWEQPSRHLSERVGVLIVDREEDFADMIRDYLQIKGNFMVSHAATALQAGLHVGEMRPDVVLYDADTKSVDIHELRHLVPAARLILLTSVWAPELESLRGDLGALALVEKPVKLDELLAIIRVG